MTPHPIWFHTLTRKNMGSASEIYRRRHDGRVRRDADDELREPLTSTAEYSGSSWYEKVDELEGERGRVAEEGVEDDRHVLARALEVRGVARRRDGHAADDAHHLECLLE